VRGEAHLRPGGAVDDVALATSQCPRAAIIISTMSCTSSTVGVRSSALRSTVLTTSWVISQTSANSVKPRPKRCAASLACGLGASSWREAQKARAMARVMRSGSHGARRPSRLTTSVMARTPAAS